jgi:Flagellar hook-length control protein FliK
MPIVITPSVSPAAAQGAPAPIVLQPGSVISARVQQILGNDTVRISIGGQSIDVQSQVPLQAGQTLQLQVSQATDGSIRLAVVNQPPTNQGPAAADNATLAPDTVTLAPDVAANIAAQTSPGALAAKIQLTPQETLAVSVAAQTAATQQTGLAPLFANLAVAAGLENLPPQLHQAVAQVLAQRTSLDSGLTGADIEQAFQSSGLFLEASLASGSLSSSTATPDLKAALIVLRQVLTTSLNGVAATANTPATAVVVPTGATTTVAVVQQGGTTPPAVVVQQGATAVAGSLPGAAPTVAVAQQANAAVSAMLQPGTQPSAPGPSQPVTITVVPPTPATASPPLAPEIVAAAASLQAAVPPIAPDVRNVSVAGQIVLPPSTPADAAARAVANSAALNLLQEAVRAAPLAAFNPSGLVFENSQMLSLVPVVSGARAAAVDEAEFAHTNTPPPPIAGALPAAQPVLPATLVSNSPAESAMHRLLADTDAAIARQTLLQVASLPDRVDSAAPRIDPASPRWNFEIPFATSQGTAMAQFEISRDSGGNEVEASKRVWRARFSLDVEPAGPVHALVSLSGDRTSVRMWAERPATAAQLRAGAAQLSQALSKAELQPGDIVIRDGAPPQSAPARAGHFLDRAL